MTETTTKKEFDHGDRAWTRDGVKVYVEAETTAGMYLVCPLLDIGSYDPEYGPASEDSGPYMLVDELWAEPPRQFVDADIAAAKQELEGLRDQLGDVRSEIREALAERTRLLTKLKEVPALQHIERMLDGKMRFVVVERYGEVSAMTIEKAQEVEGWRDHRRLITLTTGKEGVGWSINEYHDGSGSNFKVWFFETMKDAQAEATAKVGFQLDDAFARYLKEGDRYASSVVLYAQKLSQMGGKIPDDIAAVLTDVKRKDLRQTIEANQKHASQYHGAIEKALTELRALDGEQAS